MTKGTSDKRTTNKTGLPSQQSDSQLKETAAKAAAEAIQFRHPGIPTSASDPMLILANSRTLSPFHCSIAPDLCTETFTSVREVEEHCLSVHGTDYSEHIERRADINMNTDVGVSQVSDR